MARTSVGLGEPVLHAQSRYAFELPDVAGHDSGSDRFRVRGDEQIVATDRSAARFEASPN